MSELLLYSALLGCAAGVSAGLFGIGGGVLIVPVLTWILAPLLDNRHALLIAIATSLASAFFTSLSSVRTHQRLGNVVWQRAVRLAPILLIGASLGAGVAQWLDKQWLKLLFVLYLLYTSWTLTRGRSAPTPDRQSRPFWDIPMGLLIGVLSALVGIGGGTMSVPYLLKNGLAMKNAVATSSACALPITLSAAVSYIWLGRHLTQMPPYSLGYIYLPAFVGIVSTSLFTAPWGARLASRLPALKLKRYFGLLLIVMAAKLAAELQGEALF
jgi:uncharacterized protein